MSPRLRWRKFVSGFMLTMTGVCALVAVSVLFFILGYLVYHGGRSINWDFFTKLPTPVGETGGGMANAIVGSAKLLLLASLLGVPIGFLGAIYLAEFSGSKVAFVVRYAADLLNGVPSIVIGMPPMRRRIARRRSITAPTQVSTPTTKPSCCMRSRPMRRSPPQLNFGDS